MEFRKKERRLRDAASGRAVDPVSEKRGAEMRVPSAIAGEYYRLGTAVREKRMTVEQAFKELAQICVDRHEHFGLKLTPIEGEARQGVEQAAVAFRESLIERADKLEHGRYPLWHGWALYDAFLAGAKWQALSTAALENTSKEK
jgi:hypothetical protein